MPVVNLRGQNFDFNDKDQYVFAKALAAFDTAGVTAGVSSLRKNFFNLIGASDVKNISVFKNSYKALAKKLSPDHIYNLDQGVAIYNSLMNDSIINDYVNGIIARNKAERNNSFETVEHCIANSVYLVLNVINNLKPTDVGADPLRTQFGEMYRFLTEFKQPVGQTHKEEADARKAVKEEAARKAAEEAAYQAALTEAVKLEQETAEVLRLANLKARVFLDNADKEEINAKSNVESARQALKAATLAYKDATTDEEKTVAEKNISVTVQACAIALQNAKASPIIVEALRKVATEAQSKADAAIQPASNAFNAAEALRKMTPAEFVALKEAARQEAARQEAERVKAEQAKRATAAPAPAPQISAPAKVTVNNKLRAKIGFKAR